MAFKQSAGIYISINFLKKKENKMNSLASNIPKETRLSHQVVFDTDKKKHQLKEHILAEHFGWTLDVLAADIFADTSK